MVVDDDVGTVGVAGPGELFLGAVRGFRVAFLAGSILVGCAALSALLIHDEDAVPTMQPVTDGEGAA